MTYTTLKIVESETCLTIYLNSPDPDIKKAAFKAIYHILEKQPEK